MLLKKGTRSRKSNSEFTPIFTNKQNYCARTFITYLCIPNIVNLIVSRFYHLKCQKFSFQLELDWNYHIGSIGHFRYLKLIPNENLFSYQFNCGWKSYHFIIYTDYKLHTEGLKEIYPNNPFIVQSLYWLLIQLCTHSNTTLIKQKSCILILSSELVRIKKHWKYLFHTANKFLSWILKHHLGPKCWVPSWNDDGRAIYKQITVLLFFAMPEQPSIKPCEL